MNLWEAFYVLFLFLICKLHAGRVCAIRPDQLIPFLIHLNYLNFGLNRALISDRIAELIHLTASFVSCNYLLDSSCRRVFFFGFSATNTGTDLYEYIYISFFLLKFRCFRGGRAEVPAGAGIPLREQVQSGSRSGVRLRQQDLSQPLLPQSGILQVSFQVDCNSEVQTETDWCIDRINNRNYSHDWIGLLNGYRWSFQVGG